MEDLRTFLPFVVFLLICPLMMLFMHRGGHGGDQHDHAGSRDPVAPRANALKDEVLP